MSTDVESKQDTSFEFDPEVYGKFVEGIDLIDVRLMNFQFNVKSDYFTTVILEKEQKKGILSRSYDHVIEKIHYQSGDEIVITSIKWNVTIKRSRKKVLIVEAEYLVAYDGASNVDYKYVEKFIDKVVPFTTYPYFREKVSQFSWSSGAELPILPVLKVK